ncbi:MAG: hypothetical protein C0596_16530 [Marinilabiliales bacterium]|nr:MAG: hypothetical protein C0596_16530 [Marinilabiliales bacterium]
MKKLILLLIICGYFTLNLFSQEGKLEFTQIKVADEGYTVYFHVVNLIDDEHGNMVLAELLNDENIFSGRYFKSGEGKDRFQLYINEFVSAEYVRNILLSQNVDYEFSTVTVNGNYINGNNQTFEQGIKGSPKMYVTSMGFPKYEYTGDKEQDDINYRNAKDDWINQNPEEYEKLLEDLKEEDNQSQE